METLMVDMSGRERARLEALLVEKEAAMIRMEQLGREGQAERLHGECAEIRVRLGGGREGEKGEREKMKIEHRTSNDEQTKITAAVMMGNYPDPDGDREDEGEVRGPGLPVGFVDDDPDGDHACEDLKRARG